MGKRIHELNPDFHWSVKYFEYFLIAGVVFTAIAVFIYNYSYYTSGDGLVGLIAACSLFLGAVFLGQGARALREIKHFKDQFIDMSKIGTKVKKRKKKWSR